MAEQLTLFQDLLPLDKKQENINQRKPEIKSQRDRDHLNKLEHFGIENSSVKHKDYPKKEEKPFHIYNPVTQELDNVNDPNYLKPKTINSKQKTLSEHYKWLS